MGITRWMTPVRRRVLAAFASAVVLLSIAVTAPAAASPEASAVSMRSGLERALGLSGSSFNAGYIIDDANFYQRSAMTQTQIQAFLVSKVACANSNCLANLKTKTEARANDRNICLGYKPDSDATESAAAIIYKVQQSCGISARVLLVTLQKEQGLITKPAPTTGQLNAAMGYRCPDTAPCSNQAAGFFRQIYGAAWQFRRYSYPDLWGNYHVGTYSIAYSTSASCGRKTVSIRNNATAALYNYTPYTPNSGALSNLRGTANCGSYGNRNFWVFYNDWFGSPLAGAGEGAINAVYSAAGGATGVLGAQVTTGACQLKATACRKDYEQGRIAWSTSGGAHAITGAVWDYYRTRSSTLGYPTADAVTVDADAGDAGVYQSFSRGLVSSGPAGTFMETGLYRTKLGRLGGVSGDLGWPTGEKTCKLTGKACVQPFQHGALLSKSSTAAVWAVVDPEIFAAWSAAGGASGTFGIPRADAVTVTVATGNGATQSFAGGYLADGPSGLFSVVGAVRSAFGGRGAVTGVLGWPTANGTCGLPGGVCSQTFQGGTLYTSSKTEGAVTLPAIAEYYASMGGQTGSLGLPAKDVVALGGGANGAGSRQTFTKALVHSSAAGTFAVSGAFRTALSKTRGVAGTLGWPTSDQTCGLPNNGCSQAFQKGIVTVDSKGTRIEYLN